MGLKLFPVFEVNISGLVKCKVYEKFTGSCPMQHSHVSGHIEMKKHKHCLQSLQTYVSNVPIIVVAPVKKQPGLSILVDHIHFADDLCPPSPDPTDDTDYALADLVSDLQLDHTHSYLDEIQNQMEEGKPLLTCLLHPGDKLSLEMDCDIEDMSDDNDRLLNAFVAEFEGTYNN